MPKGTTASRPIASSRGSIRSAFGPSATEIAPSTSVEVSDAPAHLDLQLNKITSVNKLATQLTNVEWRMSIPGTPQEKARAGLLHLPHAAAHHVLALQRG